MLIKQILEESGVNSTETEILLAYLLNKDRSFIKVFPEFKLNTNQVYKLNDFIQRRIKHEPLAYILGYKDFFGLRFKTDKRVLIPRPETEGLVEKVIDYALSKFLRNRQINIIDVGTGSANIAVSLAENLPNAKILAIEKDKKAFELAEENIKLHKASKQVALIQGDLLNQINKRVDIVVANLPYIPTEKISNLQPEIKNWEPKIALDGGSDGLVLYRQLFLQAKNILKKGGRLFYEVDGTVINKAT